MLLLNQVIHIESAKFGNKISSDEISDDEVDDYVANPPKGERPMCVGCGGKSSPKSVLSGPRYK
ncbi:5448_t:CDS:2 [Cetraspora pellucida]|uniref:5448_t:CDS:1 n=1 Tax=Cetraspora pellucida TaxID=1433469 RepID=A0A9N8VJH9_9GLOM|nr:5448_t:CDS:2 [Cetraspora pellucida]